MEDVVSVSHAEERIGDFTVTRIGIDDSVGRNRIDTDSFTDVEKNFVYTLFVSLQMTLNLDEKLLTIDGFENARISRRVATANGG
jgi:hypothetical protein